MIKIAQLVIYPVLAGGEEQPSVQTGPPAPKVVDGRLLLLFTAATTPAPYTAPAPASRTTPVSPTTFSPAKPPVPATTLTP